MKRIVLAAVAVVSFAVSAQAQTDNWPSRPIMLVVPFPAGGGTDAFARPLAQQLDQQLGTRVLIENRAGAGGNAGAAIAAKATPDGYTFFVGAAHHAIAPSIYAKLPYDIEKDFIPIALLSRPPHVIVVAPGKVEAKSVAELIAAAKANPGKINYASGGNGTTHHLAGELFKLVTGTSLLHVPYRGAGPMMQDLVAGHVDMAFDAMGSSGPQIKSGAIRALAVAAPQRVKGFPDLPTAKELGLDYEVATWYALWAPAGTPRDIVERMKKEVTSALQSSLVRDAWEKAGSDIPNLTGEEFGKYVTSEIARWGKVVKDAGVRIDQ